MAIIKFEYGKWDSVMGYQCSQCGWMFPYVCSACQHEKKIEENGGICPDKKEESEK